MLLLHAARGINSGWPFLAGFDTTFGITSKKFELIGISINSLRRGANPVCLFIVNAKTPARTTSPPGLAARSAVLALASLTAPAPTSGPPLPGTSLTPSPSPR